MSQARLSQSRLRAGPRGSQNKGGARSRWRDDRQTPDHTENRRCPNTKWVRVVFSESSEGDRKDLQKK